MVKDIKYILTPAQLLDLQKLLERISLHLEIKQGGIFIIGTESDETKSIIEKNIKKELSKFSCIDINLRKLKDPLLKQPLPVTWKTWTRMQGKGFWKAMGQRGRKRNCGSNKSYKI